MVIVQPAASRRTVTVLRSPLVLVLADEEELPLDEDEAAAELLALPSPRLFTRTSALAPPAATVETITLPSALYRTSRHCSGHPPVMPARTKISIMR